MGHWFALRNRSRATFLSVKSGCDSMVESVRRWFHAWLGFATPRCTEEYAAYSCPECKDALQSTPSHMYTARFACQIQLLPTLAISQQNLHY